MGDGGSLSSEVAVVMERSTQSSGGLERSDQASVIDHCGGWRVKER